MAGPAGVADFSGAFVVEDDVASAEIRINRPVHKGGVREGGKPAWRGPSHGQPKVECEELDKHKLAQRQKQVDFGKNTIGYQRYLELIPKERRTRRDPTTPDINQRVSKRCFDGQIKAWRRLLHQYDEGLPKEEAPAPGSAGRNVTVVELLGQETGSRFSAQDEQGKEFEYFQDSPRSKGSLDGYLPPANHPARKRIFGSAFENQSEAQGSTPQKGGQREEGYGEPEPKRSTASKQSREGAACGATACAPVVSCEASQPENVPVPAAGPATTFAGLAGTTPGGVSGVKAPGTAAAAGASTNKRGDNVLSLILGGENGSCMSWADQSLDGVGL